MSASAVNSYEMESLATVVGEQAERVAKMGEGALADKADRASAELFDAERHLRSAQRLLSSAAGQLKDQTS